MSAAKTESNRLRLRELLRTVVEEIRVLVIRGDRIGLRQCKSTSAAVDVETT